MPEKDEDRQSAVTVRSGDGHGEEDQQSTMTVRSGDGHRDTWDEEDAERLFSQMHLGHHLCRKLRGG